LSACGTKCNRPYSSSGHIYFPFQVFDSFRSLLASPTTCLANATTIISGPYPENSTAFTKTRATSRYVHVWSTFGTPWPPNPRRNSIRAGRFLFVTPKQSGRLPKSHMSIQPSPNRHARPLPSPLCKTAIVVQACNSLTESPFPSYLAMSTLLKIPLPHTSPSQSQLAMLHFPMSSAREVTVTHPSRPATTRRARKGTLQIMTGFISTCVLIGGGTGHLLSCGLSPA